MNEVAEKVNGGMAAIIGLDSDKIIEELKKVDGVVEAVNFNEPKQTVIAGEKDAIAKACEVLKEAGARRAMPLAVSGPFHSSLMKEAGEKLKEEELRTLTAIPEETINRAFLAAAEAEEEAILNSMAAAGETRGLKGEYYRSLSDILSQEGEIH